MVERITSLPFLTSDGSSYEYRPSQQEHDVLKMKLRSILTQNMELRSSIPSLLKAPIDGVVVIPKNECTWEIVMFQDFQTKQGKRFRMEGRFVKKSAYRHSIPLQNTFKIQLI
jgi:hypothetical protein